MAYLSTTDLDNIVGDAYKRAPLKKAVTAETDSTKRYDIFLSHSRLDEKVIRQINYWLEEKLGFDVYLDCIEDPYGDNAVVTPSTAAHLRDVMNRCSSIIYAVSVNSASSKWMPWELGYSDATHGRVAVLPLMNTASVAVAYQNQEFVGLYPYVDIDTIQGTSNRVLWIRSPVDQKLYALLENWQKTGRFNRLP
jgi:hypothetical protein